LLTYKKNPKDKPLGNAKRATLLQWWDERQGRTSPSNSPYNSENEEEEDDIVGEGGDNDFSFVAKRTVLSSKSDTLNLRRTLFCMGAF
jgi:hypothetical protein